MNDNLKYWDSFRTPPPESLKKITGGRMSGKSGIDPQWRMKAMTERFGPVGIGWKYEIVKFWLENGDIEIMAFAHINLYYKNDDKWSEPIPGIGGSKLVAKETKGNYNSDEAFKMALTDAMSVSMKSLGVGADIYSGLWDGSKYNIAPDDDMLTFADAVSYPGLISGVTKCADLEELKQFYVAQTEELAYDPVGKAVLVRLKDYRKKELTK